MKRVAILLVITLLFPSLASAQTSSGERKLVKILVGSSLLVVGAVVVANSGESRTVENGATETSTSSFSSSQLITGLAIAGAGGIVLWSALRNPGSATAPSLSVGATAGKTRAVFLRKVW